MFKRKSINLAALLALGAAALPAVAQNTQLDRVEITGSSIKRIDAETSLPVSVISRDSINKSGASNVQELVDRLSYNNGGGLALGQSIGDGSANGQVGASLRGLGRGRTLVLLNGRRLPVYPFSGQGVDLNAIPLAAIERVEVLRDGASATYGSDAIGGVMNFITRKDFQGGDISVGLELPKTVGDVFSFSAGGGVGDLSKDKWNLLESSSSAMAQTLKNAYEKQEPIIVTGWTPHWMFAKMDLKYLEDPKGVYGADEQIHTVVRNGLKDAQPEAYAFLDKFNWTPDDMAAVMIQIEEGSSPEEAAKEWVEANADKVDAWLK